MEEVMNKVIVGTTGTTEGTTIGEWKGLAYAKIVAGKERKKLGENSWSIIKCADGTEIKAGNF